MFAQTVGHSDHCLLYAIYKKWSDAKGGEKRKLCDSLGLAESGMREMKQLRDQLDGSLKQTGFTNNKNSNANGEKWRVVRAVVIAALSPNGMVRVERASAKYSETMGGAVEKDGEAKELKFFVPKGKVEAESEVSERAKRAEMKWLNG